MSEGARRTYRRFATFFMVTGGVFLGLAVLRASVAPDVLRGNPVPVALLLLAIGGALRWTVWQAPHEDEPDPTQAEGHDAVEGPEPPSDGRG
jgi:hypothetical protein